MPIQGLCQSLAQNPPGPARATQEKSEGLRQKVRRQVIPYFPFIISSCRGGVLVKLKANFSPSHSKPNYCHQNSLRKQKEKIALSSYLAYRCPSDTCFICTSCPVPPSFSPPPKGFKTKRPQAANAPQIPSTFSSQNYQKETRSLGCTFVRVSVCVCTCTGVHTWYTEEKSKMPFLLVTPCLFLIELLYTIYVKYVSNIYVHIKYLDIYVCVF